MPLLFLYKVSAYKEFKEKLEDFLAHLLSKNEEEKKFNYNKRILFMANPVHSKSSLVFTIKKGEVHYKQKETYKIGGGDKSHDEFTGEVSLDSDKLKEWLSGVCDSWIDGDSLRDDAVTDEDDDE